MANYATTLMHEVEVIAHSRGVTEPRALDWVHCRRLTGDGTSVLLEDLYGGS